MKVQCAAVVAVGLMLLSGCGTPEDSSSKLADGTAGDKPVLLTVDFEPGQTLRYRFVSSRKTILDWDPAQSNPNRIQEQLEQLEMVVAFTPVEVDPYAVSTVRAVCESVKATRGGGTTRRMLAADAVETAQGKTCTIKVDPRGKVVDDSQLRSLIAEMGRHAFREGNSQRIKEPDMIGDFVACLWSLWDPVSSIEKPSEGVVVGQTWRSQLPVPTPMVMRKARDVTYRLDEVRVSAPQSSWRGRPALASRGHPFGKLRAGSGLAASDLAAPGAPKEQGQDALATVGDDKSRLAVIRSTYALAETAPVDWPVPYSGRFQVSGTFGFLGAYEVLSLEGEGEALFNVDAGRAENYRQQYTVEMKASLPPMGIQANPHIRIEQTLTMDRIDPEIRNTNIEIRNKLE